MRTHYTLLLSAALIFALIPVVASAATWVAPLGDWNNYNTAPPINVSGDNQYKQGGFSVGRSNTDDLIGGINLFAPISKFLTLFAQTLNLSGTGTAGETVFSATGNAIVSGNVLINGASNLMPLVVRSKGNGLAFIAGIDENNTNRIFDIAQGSNSGYIRFYRTGSVTTLVNANGNSYFNGGNVGIGTNAPTQKLHVAGNALITGLGGIIGTGGDRMVVADTNGLLSTRAIPSGGGGGDNWGTQVVQHNTTLTGDGTTALPLGVNTSVIQNRVTGTCATNNSIRTINQDGTVICEPDDSGSGGISSLSIEGTNGIGFRINDLPAYPVLTTSPTALVSGNKVTLSMGICAAGSLFQSIDNTPADGINNPTWTCVTPASVIGSTAVTSITPSPSLRGFGVTVSSPTGAVAIGANPPTATNFGQILGWNSITSAWVATTTSPYFQNRVTGTCAPGSSIRVISATGAVTCETDDFGSGSDGFGAYVDPLTLSGNGSTTPLSANETLALWNANALQGKPISSTVLPTLDGQVLKWNGSTLTWGAGADADTFGKLTFCPPGQVLEGNATSNGWTCGVDNSGTTYTAGAGIDITGTTITNTAPNADHTGDVTGATALTIGAGKVTNTKIADSAVNSAKIADGSIVAADIASNAVTSDKILNANVTFPKLAPCATAGQVLKWDGTWACATDGGVPSGLTAKFLPKWNGTALVDSSVYEDTTSGSIDYNNTRKLGVGYYPPPANQPLFNVSELNLDVNGHALVSGTVYSNYIQTTNGATIASGSGIYLTGLPSTTWTDILVVDAGGRVARRTISNPLFASTHSLRISWYDISGDDGCRIELDLNTGHHTYTQTFVAEGNQLFSGSTHVARCNEYLTLNFSPSTVFKASEQEQAYQEMESIFGQIAVAKGAYSCRLQNRTAPLPGSIETTWTSGQRTDVVVECL